MQSCDYLPDEIRDIITDYMVHNNISMVELTYELKLTYPTVHSAMKGTKKISVKTLRSFEKFISDKRIGKANESEMLD